MNFDDDIFWTGVRFPASPPNQMYLITLTDNFHGNKEGFISLTKEDIWDHLVAHLNNWDVQYTIEELDTVIRKRYGYLNEHSKSYVTVKITEIEPGQGFDLL